MNPLKLVQHFFFSPILMDNWMARLHYRCTFPFFIVLSVAMMATIDKGSVHCSTYGEPFKRTSEGQCYATYTMNTTIPYTMHGESLFDNRVGNLRLFCVIVAVMPLLPRFLWYRYGGKPLTELLHLLQNQCSLEQLAKIMTSRIDLGHNKMWMTGLILMEAVNFVNTLVYWGLSFTFIHENFYQFVPPTSYSMLEKIFPTHFTCKFDLIVEGTRDMQMQTVCHIYKYSWNQDLITFVWMWFVAISAFSLLAVCYRCVLWKLRRNKWFNRSFGAWCFTDDEQYLLDLGISDWLFLAYFSYTLGQGSSRHVVRIMKEEQCKATSLSSVRSYSSLYEESMPLYMSVKKEPSEDIHAEYTEMETTV